jgi:hypothetical protein
MNHGSWKPAAWVAIVCSAAFLPKDFATDAPFGDGSPTPQDAPKPDAKPAEPTPVPEGAPVVAMTGNEKGFIRPCGCSKPKLGGIDRRAYAFEQLRKKYKNFAAVAIGEMLTTGGRQQELKLDAFLMAMSAMGYQAFVPGAGDFRVGAQAMVEKMSLASFPFVLANAKIGDTSPFTPQIKLGDTGGVLIGLIEDLPPTSGVTTSPAAEVLAREIESAAGAPFILVVYNGPDEKLEAVAAAVPTALRVKTILAVPGTADAPLEMPKPLHAMPIVVPGAKGRAIALVRPGMKPLVDSMLLEEKMPLDPTAAGILDGYRTAVRDENLIRSVNRVAAPGKYMGDANCKSCHAQAFDDLVDSRHQHAFETLVKSRDERDPECAKCHVTGWALEGGFVDVDATPERKDVDCEQCHGPSSEHAANPRVKTPGGKVTKDTCLKCHDPENSPGFEFEKYWPKIIHR